MTMERASPLGKVVESAMAHRSPAPDFLPPDSRPPPLEPGKQPQTEEDFPSSPSPSDDPVETVPPL